MDDTLKLKGVLPDGELLRFYEQMAFCREFEESCAEQYAKGEITGFLHLYSGQEAIAVGCTAGLKEDDYILSAYRDHAQAIVRGADPKRVMAELFGRATGICKGKGGSMHLFAPEFNFMGGYAIVGGQFPIAVGLAFASSQLGQDRVTACFFGDGAVAEGAFHEAMNLAALWKLPVLFCCENNLYGMGTAVARAQAQTDLCAKAASYTVPSARVDGMDVLAVYQATRDAAAHVRAGNGPFFLEYRTYRFRAHSMFDPELYRDKAEVEEWKLRDPIDGFAARLRAEGLLDDAALDALDAVAQAEVAASVDFAEAAEWEAVEDLLVDVTTPGGQP